MALRPHCHKLFEGFLSCNPQEQDGDEVDKLFAQYEAEAAADRAKVESKVKKQSQKPNLSMKNIREAGLFAPIGHDNRYALMDLLT